MFPSRSVTTWFYGFRLHPVINARRELCSLCLTPGKQRCH
ncbi:MAG: transposase [Treponema sp.]|nr:transposase [Treponema sp.]